MALQAYESSKPAIPFLLTGDRNGSVRVIHSDSGKGSHLVIRLSYEALSARRYVPVST